VGETTPSTKAKRSRKKMSQERVMVLFTLFFGVGITILSFLPENSSIRGMVMACYSILVFWAYFKFS
jgi:hypothetical protein